MWRKNMIFVGKFTVEAETAGSALPDASCRMRLRPNFFCF